MKKITLSEKKSDLLLNIKTRGVRNSVKKQHFRYEPTPYSDLFLLFEKVILKDKDYFVDFGSGKGRVCFYVNYLFNCHTDGIEINLTTYHEALLNLETYNLKHKNKNILRFHLEYAENYIIEPLQNIFFFFNPFEVTIFKKVIYNITKSIADYPREITIILTYPIVEYVSFILEETDFVVVDYIEANNINKNRNKFIILKNL